MGQSLANRSSGLIRALGEELEAVNSSLVGAWNDLFSSKVAALEGLVANLTAVKDGDEEDEEEEEEVLEPPDGFVKVERACRKRWIALSYRVFIFFSVPLLQLGPSTYYGFYREKADFRSAFVLCAGKKGAHLPVFNDNVQYQKVTTWCTYGSVASTSNNKSN